jgi:hypothetical protein
LGRIPRLTPPFVPTSQQPGSRSSLSTRLDATCSSRTSHARPFPQAVVRLSQCSFLIALPTVP